MLAGYKIIREIGSGGFGKVFLAEEEISGREVAIKSLKGVDKETIEELIREIKIISQFYHPNIVTYHTTFQDKGIVFFVMEYCSKGSLADIISIDPIPVEDALTIIFSIAKALKLVHQKNIVHHDIKPSNILITENGEVKLADFGVANSFGFTKLYVPPLIVDAESYITDKRLDIYALGMTFIELILGAHPLKYLSFEQAIEKLQNGDLGISHLPEWLKEIVLKAVNLNAEFRFQTIDEFIIAIENKEVSLNIDRNLITASKKAKSIAKNLRRKKYYTLKSEIEHIRTQIKEYPILMEQIGKYYLAINDIIKAKETFEFVRKKTPSLKINKELGVINLELGQYTNAINLLKEHISLNPEDCEAYNLLLECYFKNKRYSTGLDLCIQLRMNFPLEDCFRANQYIFDRLTCSDPITIDNIYQVQNNIFINYNISIFKSKSKIANKFDNNNILHKLLFCPFSITKTNGFNENLIIEIYGKKQEINSDEFITIGRKGFNNLIEFEGNDISRKHCVILPFTNENWLYDLQSTGTFVDGLRVNGKFRLTHKHEINISNQTILINIDKYKLF